MSEKQILFAVDYKVVREAFNDAYKKTMKLIENGETHLDNLAEGFTEAERVLRTIPRAEAVTVHCRDCKKYHKDIGWCDEHSHFILHDEFCHPWESSDWKMFPEDYYCADGERKHDGE